MMRKFGIIAMSIIIMFCLSCKKKEDRGIRSTVKDTTPQTIEETKKKIRETLLPQFSDVRKYPEVYSEREVASQLIDDAFGRNFDETKELSKEPLWKDARVGGLILVQNLWNMMPFQHTYFYMAYAVNPQNYILLESVVSGIVGEKASGKFGERSYAREDTFKEILFMENDVINFIKVKLNLSDSIITQVQVKAVSVPTKIDDVTEWGWAIKLPQPVAIIALDGKTYNPTIFWLHHIAYDIEATNAVLKEKDKSEFQDWLNKTVRFGFLEHDPFDEKNVAYFYDTRRNSNLQDAIYINNNYFKVIPIEYYNK